MKDDDEICDLQITLHGGRNDGVVFISKTDEETNTGYFESPQFPEKRFKQVFVPIEMEHPDFI